ncbi:MAG: tyrosine-type recombinase/integrase [Lacrimispora saccharolytica]
MKEFQSVFRNELEEYLKINQGTVNEDTLRNTRRVLLSFDSSLAEENTNVISEAAVNRWIREIRQTNAAKTVSDKVSYLRKFLRYLQYKGYRVFMPDCPKTSDSYVPYIFSDEEIQILLARADSWADKHTDPKICQTDMEFCMLLRMLLGCGFRLGEPLAAKVKDINFQSGTILIRHAKNNKQRVIPMDVTLTQMLERYCIAMGIKTEPESYLFPSSKNKGAAVSKGTLIYASGTFTGNRPVCSGQGPFKRPVPSLFPSLFCHPFLCAGRTERTASGRFCALPVGLSWTP